MSEAGADVRGFYAALGVELPGWSQQNVTVRCFANPSAHAHEDRTPSCSVSLEHGAWRCWGCGESGGAYDAALARGHTPATAMEFKVRYGLAERREPAARNAAQVVPSGSPEPPRSASRRALAATDAEISRWHERLFSSEGKRWLALLARERLWHPATIRDLELGHDGWRITIPIRSGRGELRGVLRYKPNALAHKMLAVPGTRLGLIPHPARETSTRVMLVEGPPDMVAARSRGWPAIAVPGDHAWRPEWARLLAGRHVTVVMDSDPAGRAAAQRISADLQAVAAVRVVDLAPARDDGYDLTNWLRERSAQRRARCRTSSLPSPTITR
jgi:hypothetical protein